MEIGGFSMGHAQDEDALTGCTVLLFDQCSPAGVDIRGGGPASRETPLLSPLAASRGLHGILLSGGSAFGLDAAGGVMRYLEERGIGFDVGVTKVPLVCQSSVFDLSLGRKDRRPDGRMAYQACENANRGPAKEGCVGVGCGCSVGKYRGMEYAMKSGFGTYGVEAAGIKVGAVVAVNALGDIYDLETGRQIAGLLNEEKNALCSTEEAMCQDIRQEKELFAGNTTIGAVLTNAAFDKAQMNKIASMAYNGYARTIRPVNTTADGDSIYGVSLGNRQADLNVVGTLAAYVMGMAVNQAVRQAKSMGGLKSAGMIETEDNA